MELTASETTAARMIGLGNGDSSQSYTDIEYAFKLGGGGGLDIWQSGNPIGSVGTYATGDVLRVALKAGWSSTGRMARCFTPVQLRLPIRCWWMIRSIQMAARSAM